MSKRNREKRQNKKVTSLTILQTISQSLRADFSCTEEEVELIQAALQNEAPQEIVDHMQVISEGKIPFPDLPPIRFDTGVDEKNIHEIHVPREPAFLLLDFLEERYERRFAFLYWNALISSRPQKFYDELRAFKEMPAMKKILEGERVQFGDPAWLATHAKVALDYLTPLIRPQNISPAGAIILAAGVMDHNITGKQRGIPEDEMLQACKMIVAAWQQGLFTPNENYPYTLEETLKALQEDEDRSEGEDE